MGWAWDTHEIVPVGNWGTTKDLSPKDLQSHQLIKARSQTSFKVVSAPMPAYIVCGSNLNHTQNRQPQILLPSGLADP